MKQLRKGLWALLIAAFIAVICMAGASAAPARSREQSYTQLEQTFTGTPRGDERYQYVVAQDGTVLTKGEDGLWYYAGTGARYLLDSPPQLVSEADWVTQQNALHPAENHSESLQTITGGGDDAVAQVSAGTHNLLVLLVDFKDAKIQYEAQWAQQVFGEQNSVKSYYLDATNNKVLFVPAKENYAGSGAVNDGVVKVSLGYKHPNDGGNAAITRDAIRAAASNVNFASYDSNNDKKIMPEELKILVVCAGYEGSYGDYEPSVWGHRSSGALTNYGSLAGGKSFYSYTQIGEVHDDEDDAEAHISSIGIICHELGHELGLPDLYCNGTGAGLSVYSLMASGSWGRQPGEYAGTTPVFFDAYCLEQLGVMTVETLPTGQAYTGTVNSISTGKKNILRINVNGSSEYFLIENRQKESYDLGINYFSSLAWAGIAVYRVNPAYSNNYQTGRWVVTLLEADESIHGYSRVMADEKFSGTPFFYVSSIRPGSRPVTLNRNTKPSTNLQSGGSGWFNFICKSEASPSMEVEINPILSAGPPNITLDYRRGTGKINVSNNVGTPKFTSSNNNIVTVDSNGNLKAVDKRRAARGTTAVTVSDDSEFTEIISVTVQYNWWQWIIVIVLFGWIWY